MQRYTVNLGCAGEGSAEYDMLTRCLTADDILLRHRQQCPNKGPAPHTVSPRLHITNLMPHSGFVAAGDALSSPNAPVPLSMSGNALRSLQHSAAQQHPFGLDFSSLKSAGLTPTQVLLQSNAHCGYQLKAVTKQGLFVKQLSPSLSRQASAGNQSADLLNMQGSVPSQPGSNPRQQGLGPHQQGSGPTQHCEVKNRQGVEVSQEAGLSRQTSASRQHLSSLQRQGSASSQHSVPLARQGSVSDQGTGHLLQSRSIQHARSPQGSLLCHNSALPTRQGSVTLQSLVQEQLPVTPVLSSQRFVTSPRQACRSTSLSAAVTPALSPQFSARQAHRSTSLSAAVTAPSELSRGAAMPPSLADMQLDGRSIRSTVSNAAPHTIKSCQPQRPCSSVRC